MSNDPILKRKNENKACRACLKYLIYVVKSNGFANATFIWIDYRLKI